MTKHGEPQAQTTRARDALNDLNHLADNEWAKTMAGPEEGKPEHHAGSDPGMQTATQEKTGKPYARTGRIQDGPSGFRDRRGFQAAILIALAANLFNLAALSPAANLITMPLSVGILWFLAVRTMQRENHVRTRISPGPNGTILMDGNTEIGEIKDGFATVQREKILKWHPEATRHPDGIIQVAINPGNTEPAFCTLASEISRTLHHRPDDLKALTRQVRGDLSLDPQMAIHLKGAWVGQAYMDDADMVINIGNKRKRMNFFRVFTRPTVRVKRKILKKASIEIANYLRGMPANK